MTNARAKAVPPTSENVAEFIPIISNYSKFSSIEKITFEAGNEKGIMLTTVDLKQLMSTATEIIISINYDVSGK